MLRLTISLTPWYVAANEGDPSGESAKAPCENWHDLIHFTVVLPARGVAPILVNMSVAKRVDSIPGKDPGDSPKIPSSLIQLFTNFETSLATRHLMWLGAIFKISFNVLHSGWYKPNIPMI
jgi:hypothetical protein